MTGENQLGSEKLNPGQMVKADCSQHGEWWHQVEEDGKLTCTHADHNKKRGIPGYWVDRLPSESLTKPD